MAAAFAPEGHSELFIGLMSGTSLDGVDAVLADFTAAMPRVLAHVHRPFPLALREELLALSTPGIDEIERSGAASLALADLYAECVAATLVTAHVPPGDVCAIGAHGQTVRHRPGAGFTVQLNAPARLAERTGIDVVADFRSRDLAAGGQGAPLVPAFHAAAFMSSEPRAVVNIGGISNITFLPTGDATPLGFDCGPGNMLLDLHASRHLPEAFDRDGAFALGGRVDESLLGRLLAEPFLDVPPPKSTGRELFSAAWLDALLKGVTSSPRNVQRTLTEFTARCIADAMKRWCSPARDVVVCGGGTRNRALMDALETALAPRPVMTSDALGIPPDQVEALAFAWLARRCMRRETGSLPTVTGARGARVLGAIYPR
jgi:anhydro-N-acetylmuramic acid kinase